MKSLQEEFGMSIMIITHNLGVVAEMADDVVVMYLGEVVEHTDVESIFYRPKHPYTRALLKSIPKVGRKVRVRLESIKGTVPDPFMALRGCPFHPRCPEAMSGVCNVDKPPLVEVEKGHKVACFLYGGR